MRVANGRFTAFVGGKLAGIRAMRAEKPGEHQPSGNEDHANDKKKQDPAKFGEHCYSQTPYLRDKLRDRHSARITRSRGQYRSTRMPGRRFLSELDGLDMRLAEGSIGVISSGCLVRNECCAQYTKGLF